MSKIMCKYCLDCKQIGRMQDQGFNIGRKKYYCKNTYMSQVKDKYGYPHDGFIGFGETTTESQIAIKTSPRWCPKKKINQ